MRMEKSSCRKAQYHRLWQSLEVSKPGKVSFTTKAGKEGGSTQGSGQAPQRRAERATTAGMEGTCSTWAHLIQVLVSLGHGQADQPLVFILGRAGS